MCRFECSFQCMKAACNLRSLPAIMANPLISALFPMQVNTMLALFISSLCFFLTFLLTRFNSWLYEPSLKPGQAPLPPGHMGLPIFGNMPRFLLSFKRGDPQAFIGSYIKKYKRTGLYKAFLFGQPTVLVTSPETCKAVLMGDENFVPGWPESTVALIGRKSFTSLEPHEHKRLRKLTAAFFNGPPALQKFMAPLQFHITSKLSHWASSPHPVFLLTELRKLTFQIIADLFMGCNPGERCDAIEKNYLKLNVGVRAMPINFPGTAYHTALKCRKKLVAVLQEFVDERRHSMQQGYANRRDDILEAIMLARDEDGKVLTDEEIIDLLIMYLNAGHESSAHTMMWILINLQKNPQVLEKLKKEHLDIRKSRGEGNSLVWEDFRNMRYTSLVIDETLRLLNISPMVFRKSLKDVEINGYTIPKGWHVQIWLRQVHLDPEVHNGPFSFNPARWEGAKLKQGEFIPFGAGVHMCPGNDFAKLEISMFLHYAALDYKFEPQSSGGPVVYLPHPRPRDNYPVRVLKREEPIQD